MIKLKIILFLLIIFLQNNIYSQDSIIKINGKYALQFYEKFEPLNTNLYYITFFDSTYIKSMILNDSLIGSGKIYPTVNNNLVLIDNNPSSFAIKVFLNSSDTLNVNLMHGEIRSSRGLLIRVDSISQSFLINELNNFSETIVSNTFIKNRKNLPAFSQQILNIQYKYISFNKNDGTISFEGYITDFLGNKINNYNIYILKKKNNKVKKITNIHNNSSAEFKFSCNFNEIKYIYFQSQNFKDKVYYLEEYTKKLKIK